MRTLLLAAAAVFLAAPALAQHDHMHMGDTYFDSGSSDDGSDWLQPGETFEFTFDITHGTFGYHCHPHPWMLGNITVEGEAMDHDDMQNDDMDDGMMDGTVHEVHIVEGNVSDINSYRYEPAELTIQVGDTVKWINDGSMAHTVTALEGTPEAHDDSAGTPGFEAVLAVAVLGTAACLRRR